MSEWGGQYVQQQVRVHLGEQPQRVAQVPAVVVEVIRQVLGHVALQHPRAARGGPAASASDHAWLEGVVGIEEHPASEDNPEQQQQHRVRQWDLQHL